MLVDNGPVGRTHYEILGAMEDADLEELRRTYRSTILSCHPDKLQKPSKTSISELENQFLEVQRAWEILGNPKSRALYDLELKNMRQDAVASEDVNLDHMDIHENDTGFELYYPCRCGDFFSVDSSELNEMGYKFSLDGRQISLQAPASIILPCGSCSLNIRLVTHPITEIWSKAE